MKKRVLALALVFCLLFSVSACGGGTSQAAGSGSSGASQTSSGNAGTTVTVWCWDANFNIPIIEKAAEYYAAAGHEGFTVQVSEMSNDDVKTKIMSTLAAGATDTLPDIVLVEDYDAKSFIQNYAGQFADLTDIIDFSQFAQYKVDAVSHDGRTYAVPFDSGVAGLYYRTDYLEEAGYTQEDMQNLTWSRFIEIGKDVKEKTGKWFVVFRPDEASNYFHIAMQSAGVWYFDENGEINLKDNAVIREMVDVLKEMANSEVVYPVEYWSAEGIGAITGGDAAAAMSAIWYAPTIESSADQAGKWAYTNVPMLETVEGATPYSNIGGSSWFVLENSPNRDAAIDMLKEVFAGNLDFYNEILVEQGAVGTYLPSQGTEAYEAENAFFNDAQIYKDFAEWMDKIPGVDYGVNTYVAAEALASVLQDYYDGRMDKDEMLTAAEDYYKMQVG